MIRKRYLSTFHHKIATYANSTFTDSASTNSSSKNSYKILKNCYVDFVYAFRSEVVRDECLFQISQRKLLFGWEKPVFDGKQIFKKQILMKNKSLKKNDLLLPLRY